MPSFSYTAFDASGRDHAGVIEAEKAQDAVKILASQGLRVQKVSATLGLQIANVATIPALTPRPVGQFVRSIPPVAAKAPSGPEIVRTKPSKDTDLFFWFTQLANLLRSGISPVQAFEQLGSRQRNQAYADAFRRIAQYAGEGRSMSEAMALYPDLFPEGPVGAVRSGENGGYLWQACQQVAAQMQSAAAFRRFYYWSFLTFWLNIITFPLLFAGTHGVDRAIASVNTPDKVPIAELGRGLLEGFTGPMMWLSVALGLAVYFCREWTKQSAQRRMRHGLALKVPLLGKRNRAESMQVFSYHLAMLGRAGLTPFRSWQLAAAAVPNLVLAENFAKAGEGMNESTPMSSALFKSDAFPHEMACVVETGEMSGQAPAALDQVAEMSRSQIAPYDVALKVNAVIWFALINLAFAAFGYAFFMRGYFDSLFKHLLSE